MLLVPAPGDRELQKASKDKNVLTIVGILLQIIKGI